MAEALGLAITAASIVANSASVAANISKLLVTTSPKDPSATDGTGKPRSH
jgi:hypothetical protein